MVPGTLRAFVLISFLAANCLLLSAAEVSNADRIAAWKAWQRQREEAVAGTNGWSTLVGLHWLHEGANYAGTSSTNDVRLEEGRAPAQLGTFVRRGKTVRFEAANPTIARIAGQPVAAADLVSDAVGEPTPLVAGALEITVLDRGERMGLRIRDPEAPSRLHFKSLKYYPYDPSWRIQGRFFRRAQTATVQVDDVTGSKQAMQSPGVAEFVREGKRYELEVMEEAGATDYLVLFRDATAGNETYPSGRFLHIDYPDAQGNVVLDFNRCYNPPCAFTAFATCPIPPRRNWLPFQVRAGELAPPGH